jgi:hypothetical protein
MTYEIENLLLKVERLQDVIDDLEQEKRELEFKLEDRSATEFNILHEIYGVDVDLTVNYTDHYQYKLHRWKDKSLNEALEYDKNGFWLHWTARDNEYNTISDNEVFDIIKRWQGED